MITWTTFFVGMALIGSVLNAMMRLKPSYILWFISNFYLSFYNFSIEEYAQGCLFIAYLVTSSIGIYNYCFKKPKISR